MVSQEEIIKITIKIITDNKDQINKIDLINNQLIWFVIIVDNQAILEETAQLLTTIIILIIIQ